MKTSVLELDFKNLSSPQNASDEICARVEENYRKWVLSDYAGFRNIMDPGAIEFPPLEAMQAEANRRQNGATGKKIRNFVILGTGGSSLGAEAIITALRPAHKEPLFYFMDNNDPAFFNEQLEAWRPEETLIYAVSKSGSTPETWSQLLVCIAWLQHAMAGDSWKQHVILCTDPSKGDFRSFAKASGLTCFDVPSSVGGRFSVFTPVGLFPAAYAGLNTRAFIEGAQEIIDAWEAAPLNKNPVFQLAYALFREPKHKITVVFSYSSYLRAFGRWFNQLWGESLGKEKRGYTPYAAIGTTDQHSQTQLYMEGPEDKIFAFHHIGNCASPLPIPMLPGTNDLKSVAILKGKSMRELFQAEFLATRDALQENRCPNFTVNLPSLSEKSMGALLYFWEWLTVYAGALLEIDPFTQPGVEKGKILTKKYLSETK